MSEELLAFRGFNVTRFCGPRTEPGVSRQRFQIDLSGPYLSFDLEDFAELVRQLRVISDAAGRVDASDRKKGARR